MPSRLTEDELARLIGSRLLRLEEHHGAQRIELTHDVLTGVVREHRDRRRRRRGEERCPRGAGGARSVRRNSRPKDATSASRTAARAAQRARRRAAKTLPRLRAMLAVTGPHSRRRPWLQCAWLTFTPGHRRPAASAKSVCDATAQTLNAQALGMLAGTQPGGDVRAFQQILAARALAKRLPTTARSTAR